MGDKLRLARLYWVLLVIFTIGRWAMALKGVPYDRGNPVFSIIALTALSAVIFSAFARRWRGYGLLDGAILGALLGLSAQIVIFASTAASYMAGLHTYFNNPLALNDPTGTKTFTMAEALAVRGPALLVGPLFTAVLASIGWVLGALLPERKA
jgi:hypothetical protein